MDAQVLNGIFAESHSDALFASSGGSTELDHRSDIAIAILGKVMQSLEILVLKDGDMASGKSVTEGERLLYLENNPDYHRVLRRWEIENYLYDNEVLKAYCADKNLNFDETSYDGFINDIVNQDLKKITAKIKNCCNIKGSISADNFKIALSAYITRDLKVFEELASCIFGRA